MRGCMLSSNTIMFEQAKEANQIYTSKSRPRLYWLKPTV
jgi:hypothetical protein